MAKLGTPENPEVIEPGRTPSPPVGGPAWPTRVRSIARALVFLALVCAPALICDSGWWWLVRLGWTQDNPLPWLLALLITPAAVGSTVVALLAAPFLLFAVVLLILGRDPRPGPLGAAAGRIQFFRGLKF